MSPLDGSAGVPGPAAADPAGAGERAATEPAQAFAVDPLLDPLPQEPPPHWVARVRGLVSAHPEHGPDGLARLLVDPEQAHQVRGAWTLYPWTAERDVTALLGWARHLEADGGIVVVRALPGAPGAVAVAGVLGGVKTRLVGHSRRLAELEPPPPIMPFGVLEDAAAEETSTSASGVRWPLPSPWPRDDVAVGDPLAGAGRTSGAPA